MTLMITLFLLCLTLSYFNSGLNFVLNNNFSFVIISIRIKNKKFNLGRSSSCDSETFRNNNYCVCSNSLNLKVDNKDFEVFEKK